MPLDPSIISNSMANMAGNMPDVNALMQQRVQGAENVYKIETARQEQAKEEARLEQERANKAAAEAMLPSVAAAYNDPSDAGLDRAVSLMPEEVRDTFAPFVARLKGISDPATRKTILEAELAKDPAGRAVLDRVMTPYQAAVTGIQREQNVLARGRLAIDQQKAALDALGQGDWELKEGEGGFFWTNPRTRQVIPADVTGGAVAPAVAAPGAVPGPTPIPAPDVVTPRMPETGVPAAEVPISTAQPPDQQPKFRPKVKEAKEEDLTEGEGKAVNFTLRMADSDAVTNELEQAGVVTTDAVTNFFLGAVSSLPLSTGANLASQLESAFNAASPTMDADEQRLARAQLDFVTAILRSESGAEIKTSEFPAEYRKYFATEGDEGNEKLLADKRRARKLAINGMKAKAGKRGQAEIDRILKEQNVGVSSVAPAAPGASFEGFEVLGVEPEQ